MPVTTSENIYALGIVGTFTKVHILAKCAIICLKTSRDFLQDSLYYVLLYIHTSGNIGSP